MIPTAPNRLLPYGLPAEAARPDEPDTMDLRAAVRFMRKNARLFLVWLAAALCIGVAFIKITPAYYTAYTTLLLEDQLARQVADQAGPAAPAIPLTPTARSNFFNRTRSSGASSNKTASKTAKRVHLKGCPPSSPSSSRAQGRETSGPSAGLASSDTATTAAAKAGVGTLHRDPTPSAWPLVCQ